MTRFVVIFEGRNGSSQLVSMLNSHEMALCYPEILVGQAAPTQLALIDLVAADGDVVPLNPYAATDQYYPGGFALKWQNRPYEATGFKTKVTDMLNAPAIMAALRRHGFRLVYLYRENILKSVVSHLNSMKLKENFGGISNAVSADQVRGRILIDLDRFDHFLERRRLSESLHRWFVEHFTGDRLRISYEAMQAPDGEVERVLLDFLGLSHQAMHGTFHKNTPARLSEAVINYDEFRARYEGTEFARFLD
jgi:hypothetical protein